MNRTRKSIAVASAVVLTAGLASQRSFAAEPPVTAIAFAPGGTAVVAVSQSGLHVFGWPDLKRKRSIKTAAANLHCVAFSPNGKLVAAGGGNPSEDGSVEVFSWPAGESVAMFADHADSVRSIAWSDNSKLAAASIDREIKLWNLENQENAALVYKGHSRSVNAICLLNDGKTLVSAGVDQSVRVWNLESAELTRSLSQHTKPIRALALRPATSGLPMVASASEDRSIRLWQPTIGRMVRYVRLDVEPLDIDWLKDGNRIVAACVDGRVRVVDADEVQVTQTLAAIEGWAYAIAAHPSDDSIAVGGRGGQLRRVRIASSEQTP
ncbi:MAG: WD40 repeat domain-containing protein [Pirellulaceae bacterium]|nr:WD40 repeat domain-containing protein [Pirellulaceae bacterium]